MSIRKSISLFVEKRVKYEPYVRVNQRSLQLTPGSFISAH